MDENNRILISKFLEIGFKDYPDNFTLRIYAKVGKDGEEFVIGNVLILFFIVNVLLLVLI